MKTLIFTIVSATHYFPVISLPFKMSSLSSGVTEPLCGSCFCGHRYTTAEPDTTVDPTHVDLSHIKTSSCFHDGLLGLIDAAWKAGHTHALLPAYTGFNKELGIRVVTDVQLCMTETMTSADDSLDDTAERGVAEEIGVSGRLNCVFHTNYLMHVTSSYDPAVRAFGRGYPTDNKVQVLIVGGEELCGIVRSIRSRAASCPAKELRSIGFVVVASLAEVRRRAIA